MSWSVVLKSVLSVVAISFIMHISPGETRAERKIGILLFSEDVRYIEAKKGIMDQLKKGGFGEPAVTYTIDNARGSDAKAVEVVRKFAAAKMNLIIAIGTSAAIPAAREIKDVPIVFSTVYDPVKTGIAKGWKSSRNNTTGSSTKIPMTKLAAILKKFAPVKRLLVLYTPGEKNSEAQLIELQKIQADFQIKVIPIILTKKEEVAETLSIVMPTADAIYLSGSSIISETVSIIVTIANKASVVTITHLDDLVDRGALLGVCADPYQVGFLAGKKAVQVLKGAKPSSLPIESPQKVDIILNKKTVKAGRFQIPPGFMNKVTKTVEEPLH